MEIFFREDNQRFAVLKNLDGWFDHGLAIGAVYGKAAEGSHEDRFQTPETAHFFKGSHVPGHALHDGKNNGRVEHRRVVGAEDDPAGGDQIFLTLDLDATHLNKDPNVGKELADKL